MHSLISGGMRCKNLAIAHFCLGPLGLCFCYGLDDLARLHWWQNAASLLVPSRSIILADCCEHILAHSASAGVALAEAAPQPTATRHRQGRRGGHPCQKTLPYCHALQGPLVCSRGMLCTLQCTVDALALCCTNCCSAGCFATMPGHLKGLCQHAHTGAASLILDFGNDASLHPSSLTPLQRAAPGSSRTLPRSRSHRCRRHCSSSRSSEAATRGQAPSSRLPLLRTLPSQTPRAWRQRTRHSSAWARAALAATPAGIPQHPPALAHLRLQPPRSRMLLRSRLACSSQPRSAPRCAKQGEQQQQQQQQRLIRPCTSPPWTSARSRHRGMLTVSRGTPSRALRQGTTAARRPRMDASTPSYTRCPPCAVGRPRRRGHRGGPRSRRCTWRPAPTTAPLLRTARSRMNLRPRDALTTIPVIEVPDITFGKGPVLLQAFSLPS